MTTRLFLRDAASSLGGSGQKLLSQTPGSASTTAVTNTVASGNNIQVTKTAAGTALTWFTEPLEAVVINGTITPNIRGLESATAANAGAGITIERTDGSGSVISTIVSNAAVGTEYGTSDGAKTAALTPTSTTLAQGDRIKVTLLVKAVGTMGGSRTVTNSYDGGTSGSAGDTYVTFTEGLINTLPADSGRVQVVQESVAASSLVIDLPASTTSGNTLIVLVAASGTSTNPTAITVDFNTAADNWTQDTTFGSSSDAAIGATWRDSNCASGKTQVRITLTGGAGTIAIMATVFERNDLAASPLDLNANSVGTSSTTWDSTSTGTTSQATEVVFGAAFATRSGAQTTITGPSSPWTNLNADYPLLQDSFWDHWIVGYQVVSSTGTFDYSGTTAAACDWIAKVVTYKQAASGASGTASLTGAGSVSVNVIQGAGASLTGAGAVAAPAVLGASVSLSESGSVAVTVTQRAGLALSGAGSVASNITEGSGGSVSGAGSVAVNIVQGAILAAIGAGVVTATNSSNVQGTADLTGAGAVSVNVIQQAIAALIGAGVVTANAGGSVPGTGTLTGAGSVSVNVIQQAVAGLIGSGLVTSADIIGSGLSVSESGHVTVNIIERAIGALIGSGAVTVTGTVISPATTGPGFWPFPPPVVRWVYGGASGSRWLITPQKLRWVTNLAGQATISVLSTEYVNVQVTAELGGTSIDPTGLTVQMAFTSPGVGPVSGDWKSATWVANTTTPGHFAQCLVGPSGGASLAAGKYDVWVKIASSPEVPVKPAGKLEIF